MGASREHEPPPDSRGPAQQAGGRPAGGLRFCMVTTFYPPHNFGGDGIGVQRLSEALVRRGHHVTVIHDADAFNMLSPSAEPKAGPDAEGLTIHRLSNRLGSVSNLLTQQFGRPQPVVAELECEPAVE